MEREGREQSIGKLWIRKEEDIENKWHSGGLISGVQQVWNRLIKENTCEYAKKVLQRG